MIAVGDERLGAVDDVAVAVVADGGGAQAGEVGADLRLGHRQRGDQAAVGDPRQPALALLVVAKSEEVGQADVVVQRHPEPAAGDAGSADLLAEDLVEAKVVDPDAAVLLGHLHREHALLGGLGEQLAGDDAVALPLLWWGVISSAMKRRTDSR